MNIRLADSADVPALLNLLLQVGHVHHVIRPDIFNDNATKYDTQALLALLQDADRPVFVAEDGEVLGYCFCVHREYDGKSVSTGRRELYIDDLCVDEKHRGQGIAKALFAYVGNYARKQGIAFVTLNVWCGNESAMAFYEAMGMKQRSITMELPMEDTPC